MVYYFQYAPVVQRIRMLGFEPSGRRFESCRVYHVKTPLLCGVFSWFLARIRTVLLRSKRGSAERSAEKLARSLFKQAEEALADILPGVP